MAELSEKALFCLSYVSFLNAGHETKHHYTKKVYAHPSVNYTRYTTEYLNKLILKTLHALSIVEVAGCRYVAVFPYDKYNKYVRCEYGAEPTKFENCATFDLRYEKVLKLPPENIGVTLGEGSISLMDKIMWEVENKGRESEQIVSPVTSAEIALALSKHIMYKVHIPKLRQRLAHLGEEKANVLLTSIQSRQYRLFVDHDVNRQLFLLSDVSMSEFQEAMNYRRCAFLPEQIPNGKSMLNYFLEKENARAFSNFLHSAQISIESVARAWSGKDSDKGLNFKLELGRKMQLPALFVQDEVVWRPE